MEPNEARCGWFLFGLRLDEASRGIFQPAGAAQFDRLAKGARDVAVGRAAHPAIDLRQAQEVGRAEDGIVRNARIAIGAATETARRLPTAEATLAGHAVNDAMLREAGRAAAAEAPVVADHHGSAAYKRVLIEVHLQRALRRALDGALR